MPVYMVYGFPWPRTGFTGIRVYIALNNIEDAAAEYIQQPLTSQLLRESLKRTEGDIMDRLPDLQFIEQYDPEDMTTEEAVSKPHAFVGTKVMTLTDAEGREGNLSWDTQILDREGSGLSESAAEALAELRDRLAPGAKIGWYLVYNGDPAREYPHSDEEEDEEGVDEEQEKSGPAVGILALMLFIVSNAD